MINILLLYWRDIPSVVLCGRVQFTWLAKQEKIAFRESETFKVTSSLLLWADIVVFVRGDRYMEANLAKQLRRAGKYLIYVLDDDLLNIPDYLECSEYYLRPKSREYIRETMSACQCFMSPSQRLIKKYGPQFERTVLIEEPALSTIPPVHNKYGPVKIGFAGSVDRTEDLENILAGALETLICKFGDQISVEFFGAKPAIANKLGLTYIPYQDSYKDYRKVMNSLNWNIGLAPMPDTEFHSCKHYNKFVEYSSFGIVSICSDLPPYSDIVRSWENGVLCANDTQSWVDAISRLIEDNELRERISGVCLKQADTELSVSAAAEMVLSGLPELSSYKAESQRMICANKIRIMAIILWCVDFVKRNGWKAPAKLWKKIFD